MEHALRYDHYKVLGLTRDATPKEIKRAYRERVKQWHPDRNLSARAPEVFHALHDAYLTLSDEAARAAYDERLRFYRPADDSSGARPMPPRSPTVAAPKPEMPATRSDRTLFRGLHATGLVFGVLLVCGICFGCLFLEWPAFTLLFVLPGLAVIPDSISGLKAKR